MPGHFRPGPISAPDAARLNDLWREVDQLRRIYAEPPLSITRSAGVPVIRGRDEPVLLCEVVSNDGAAPPAHTVKRKTRNEPTDNSVVDYLPTDPLIENVLNPLQVAWADGTLLEVWAIPDRPGYFWGQSFSDAPTDPWFFARVTGGDDATGYSWQRVHLTSPHSWVDSSVSPATGTNNAWRAPSNYSFPSLPTISPTQTMLMRPAADASGQYEMVPWGAMFDFSCEVVVDVACVAGVVTPTYKTLTVSGRDLTGSLV